MTDRTQLTLQMRPKVDWRVDKQQPLNHVIMTTEHLMKKTNGATGWI